MGIHFSQNPMCSLFNCRLRLPSVMPGLGLCSPPSCSAPGSGQAGQGSGEGTSMVGAEGGLGPCTWLPVLRAAPMSTPPPQLQTGPASAPQLSSTALHGLGGSSAFVRFRNSVSSLCPSIPGDMAASCRGYPDSSGFSWCPFSHRGDSLTPGHTSGAASALESCVVSEFWKPDPDRRVWLSAQHASGVMHSAERFPEAHCTE